MKRTTIALDDNLIKQIKQKSLEEGKSLQECINELLSLAILNKKNQSKNSKRLPAFHMGEIKIDITDRNTLLDAMEDR